MNRLAEWFLPENPDVLGLLNRQATVTLGGMEAFAIWSRGGADDAAQAVRDAERTADDVRRELLRALSKALTTPVDQEDLYWLSERLDTVINGAKNIVRESEVLGVKPDEILDKPEKFAQTICDIFGKGAPLVERSIISEVSRELSVDPKGDLVEMLRSISKG